MEYNLTKLPKNVIRKIFSILDPVSLKSAIILNKFVLKEICDKYFWINRIIKEFGLSIGIIDRFCNMNYRSYYYNLYYIFKKYTFETPISWARDGRYDLIYIMIKKKIKYPCTVLTESRKHIDIIGLLIENGANIHQVNESLLIWSAHDGNLALVKRLVEMGADYKISNYQPLRWASENGHTNVIKFLLDVGSDIHARHDWPLYMSAKNGHINTVRFLISRGANVNTRGDLPLLMACVSGHYDIVELLMEYGAPRTHNSLTACIEKAEENNHQNIVRLLRAVRL